MNDLLRSARGLAEAYRIGSASPKEILDTSIERLDQADQLGAIQWRDDERVRAAANEATERFERGDARILEGIPWTAKELLPIAGIPGLHALESFADSVPPGSAWLAERMASLGAILVARTSSPPMGSLPTTENYRGHCHNPYDQMRSSGGSSGGAAVCAALGVAPFNHGSDAGGSVRIPASWCGVVGLKPSRNRITRGPFTGDGWAGLSVEGVLTSTVEDSAWFLDLIAGPGIGDSVFPTPPRRPYLDACRDASPKRIALAATHDDLGVSPAVEAGVRAAADRLAALGHVIVEDVPPNIHRLEAGFGAASSTGIGAMPLKADQVEKLPARVRYLWEQGQRWSAVELLGTLEGMHRHARSIAAWFEGYDALLTPTLSRTAPVIGELGQDYLHAWDDFRVVLQWTWPFNVTGQPAITVPYGTSDGLPIGVQLVGRIADEDSILGLATQLQGL